MSITTNALDITDRGLVYYSGSAFSALTQVQHGVAVGGDPLGSNNLTFTAAGALGTVLVGQGAAAPIFSSSITLGTPLPIGSGGTGVSTFPTNAVIVSGATTTTPLSGIQLTNGQVLIGSTGAAPVASTLTAGTGISIINAAGSITISATASIFTWNNIAANFAALANNGYFVTASATATLPIAPNLGDTIIIQAINPATVVQASGGALIAVGNTASAANGTATSSAAGDSLTLTYSSSNTTWYARAVQGNWAVV